MFHIPAHKNTRHPPGQRYDPNGVRPPKPSVTTSITPVAIPSYNFVGVHASCPDTCDTELSYAEMSLLLTGTSDTHFNPEEN